MMTYNFYSEPILDDYFTEDVHVHHGADAMAYARALAKSWQTDVKYYPKDKPEHAHVVHYVTPDGDDNCAGCPNNDCED